MELKIKIKELQKTKGFECPKDEVEKVVLCETARIRIASSINEIRKLINETQDKVGEE